MGREDGSAEAPVSGDSAQFDPACRTTKLTFCLHFSDRWEDCAIVAWLMVVWKGMYGSSDVAGRVGNGPPGGFVDVGCGNGLL